MKRAAIVLLSLICAMSLAGCGNVKNVEITPYTSHRYPDADIRSAIETAIQYFRLHFKDCTLTRITYLGDDRIDDWQEFADRNDAADVMVLVSDFDVGASGGDGSLNPNSTYTNWKWVLVRKPGGPWEHVDHGY